MRVWQICRFFNEARLKYPPEPPNKMSPEILVHAARFDEWPRTCEIAEIIEMVFEQNAIIDSEVFLLFFGNFELKLFNVPNTL